MNQDIVQLIEKGHYLIAIKRYREVFSVGFSEAEKAVYGMKKDISYLNRTGKHSSDASYDYPTLCARVADHLRDGNKLRAIRIYQENTQVNYKDALKAIYSIQRKLI